MKIWIETRAVDYPPGTVSGRFGQSVMFMAYERLLKRWVCVLGRGLVERIDEPHQIYVDEQWARQHTLATPRPKEEKPVRIRRGKKTAQLVLDL